MKISFDFPDDYINALKAGLDYLDDSADSFVEVLKDDALKNYFNPTHAKGVEKSEMANVIPIIKQKINVGRIKTEQEKKDEIEAEQRRIEEIEAKERAEAEILKAEEDARKRQEQERAEAAEVESKIKE